MRTKLYNNQEAQFLGKIAKHGLFSRSFLSRPNCARGGSPIRLRRLYRPQNCHPLPLTRSVDRGVARKKGLSLILQGRLLLLFLVSVPVNLCLTRAIKNWVGVHFAKIIPTPFNEGFNLRTSRRE
jgi:hypothetical protein